MLNPALENQFPIPSNQHLQYASHWFVSGIECETSLVRNLNTMRTNAISAGKHCGNGMSMNWLLIFIPYEHDGMIVRTMWDINSLLHRPMVQEFDRLRRFLFVCTCSYRTVLSGCLLFGQLTRCCCCTFPYLLLLLLVVLPLPQIAFINSAQLRTLDLCKKEW